MLRCLVTAYRNFLGRETFQGKDPPPIVLRHDHLTEPEAKSSTSGPLFLAEAGKRVLKAILELYVVLYAVHMPRH
jgi:hypothetical protein